MEDMVKHLEELCVQHKVDCIIMEGCKPFAYPTIRRIHIHPIKSDISYAVALHELGHVVCEHRPEQNRVWKELLAWRWAKANAAVWTNTMEGHQKWCLHTWGIESAEIPLDLWPASSNVSE